MKKVTASGKPPVNPEQGNVPNTEKRSDGQYKDHWALSEEDLAQGYVRPVRTAYKHEVCGTVTTMPIACAKTYAANPGFYGSTFCCRCRDYFPVGENGKFVWLDYATKVGT